MLTAKSVFELAQLAEASYASLEAFPLKQAVQNPDEKLGAKMTFSPKQAEFLDKTWEAISSAHRPNTASGYSSTLFRNKADGSYVLAFRGTEANTLADLSADIGDIVTDGLAIDQIVDMYNEWQRISQANYRAAYLETLTAETAAYALAKTGQYIPGFSMTAEAYLAHLRTRTDIVIDEPSGQVRMVRFSETESTGLGLSAEIAANGLTVTGHSLGGHLATAFTRLFPGVGAEALTVNGAGYLPHHRVGGGSLAAVSGKILQKLNPGFGLAMPVCTNDESARRIKQAA